MCLSRRLLTTAAILALWLSSSTYLTSPTLASSTIYSYTDEEGVPTFTNELESVPEKYRQQLSQRDLETSEIAVTPPPVVAADPPMRSAEARTVTASGEHRMGDHDNRTDAIRLALEAAKKDALEQVATYVESITEVRDLNVTRDDIRSYTAGIVKVVDQTVSTRLEQDQVVIRVDLTAEIDPHEVVRAIAALRENEQARSELLALRAETDRLQEQLDANNRALAAATTPSDVQQYQDQRQDLLDQLQANALLSQAWTSWTYPTLGFYSSPWVGAPGIYGLLLQVQRIYPHHSHLPLAQRTITVYNNPVPPAQPPSSTPPAPRPSLLMPPVPHVYQRPAPPLLNSQGQQAKVGDAVVIPTPRSVPSAPQYTPQPPPYQLHPNHFWRPSPPNVRTTPSSPPQVSSAAPHHYSGHLGHAGGGHSSGGSRSGGSRGGRR
ncbi:MAG: DUF4124 domain-containing protein [Nitrospiraceae bacterium]